MLKSRVRRELPAWSSSSIATAFALRLKTPTMMTRIQKTTKMKPKKNRQSSESRTNRE
jgi:hypothetical protein